MLEIERTWRWQGKGLERPGQRDRLTGRHLESVREPSDGAGHRGRQFRRLSRELIDDQPNEPLDRPWLLAVMISRLVPGRGPAHERTVCTLPHGAAKLGPVAGGHGCEPGRNEQNDQDEMYQGPHTTMLPSE